MIVYPRKISLLQYVKEILRYKDLLYLMSKKWIKTKYEHSYIGIGWIIINPLITTIVYTIFFSMAFRPGVKPTYYFLFVYSGMLPWLFFKDVFLDVLDIFPKEPQIIKNLNFPRIIVPLSLVLLKLVEFCIGIVVLFIVVFIAGRGITPNIYLLPILTLEVIFFSIGMGLIFIVPCILYRDIKHMLKFVVPLGLYSLPIVYTISVVPDAWIKVYTLNPMVAVIQTFRSILFYSEPPWLLLGKGMVVSLIVFFAGCLTFVRYEKKIADYI